MVTRSTADETILQSDRVPVFVGANRLYLKKGLQSTNRTIDIPNEVIKEQGNQLNRGISTEAPQITVSFEDLAVDLDMEQVLTQSWATVGNQEGALTQLQGLVTHTIGPTDEINGMVVSYVSGASTRIGEGAIASSVTGSTTINLRSATATCNFAVGDVIIVQETDSIVNLAAVSNVITAIGTSSITVTGFDLSTLAGTSTIHVYKKDDNVVDSDDFSSGAPLTSLKGIEVYVSNRQTDVGSASMPILTYFPLTVSGTTSDIDSNDMRNSEIDILMLYNDYSDNLIFSRYIQDAAITSIGFNYTADGNATQNYDFQTGKSLDYAGYVNRRSVIASGDATAFGLTDMKGIFVGSEVVDPIAANTTLNEAGDRGKSFLKIKTMTPAGVVKNWTEIASGSTPGTDEYAFVSGSYVITFGATITSGSRMEFTYLCDAAYVATANAYKFDATAFNHVGTPDAVTGRYQPLTINNSDFDNRIDGVESTSFNLGFTRDYFNAQGILAQRVKPAQIGEVDGSFTTREGFSKVMSVITDGSYTSLSNKDQMDAGKAAGYTQANDIPLRVRLYDPADNTTEIKTVEVDAMQVTNIGNSNSVGDDSTFEVSFLGVKGNLKFSR